MKEEAERYRKAWESQVAINDRLKDEISILNILLKQKEYQLEDAFEAGAELESFQSHIFEFHTPNCNCTPLEYSSFKEWLELTKKGNE